MATRTQDMPPPGGYAKIPFKRMPARVLFSGIQMFAGYVGKIDNCLNLLFFLSILVDFCRNYNSWILSLLFKLQKT